MEGRLYVTNRRLIHRPGYDAARRMGAPTWSCRLGSIESVKAARVKDARGSSLRDAVNGQFLEVTVRYRGFVEIFRVFRLGDETRVASAIRTTIEGARNSPAT
jgi:hypothetical protein